VRVLTLCSRRNSGQPFRNRIEEGLPTILKLLQSAKLLVRVPTLKETRNCKRLARNWVLSLCLFGIVVTLHTQG
jgi:hypothetical protein